MDHIEHCDTVSVNMDNETGKESATGDNKRDSSEMDAVEIPPAKYHSVRSSVSETNLSETFTTGSISSGTATDDAVAHDDQPPNDYHHDQDPVKSVNIPDMFSSIMSVEPLINPHYEKVKPEADAWAAM